MYVSDLGEPSSSTDHQEVAVSKTQTHALVRFGILTPASTPKKRNKVTTACSPITHSTGFTLDGNLNSAPIICSDGTTRGGKTEEATVNEFG
jgi:hypothetical protein